MFLRRDLVLLLSDTYFVLLPERPSPLLVISKVLPFSGPFTYGLVVFIEECSVGSVKTGTCYPGMFYSSPHATVEVRLQALGSRRSSGVQVHFFHPSFEVGDEEGR